MTVRVRTNGSQVKAVNKFKRLLWKKRPELMRGIINDSMRIVQPPSLMDPSSSYGLKRSASSDLHDRRPIEAVLVSEGIHRTIEAEIADTPVSLVDRMDSTVIEDRTQQSDSPNQSDQHEHKGQAIRSHETVTASHPEAKSDDTTISTGTRGHAHNPTDHVPLWLGIGNGLDCGDVSPETSPSLSPETLAESPAAADYNIYDTAYRAEVERIRVAQGHTATVYLTRRVDGKKEYASDKHMVDAPTDGQAEGTPHQGWKDLLDKAREAKGGNGKGDATEGSAEDLEDVVEPKNVQAQRCSTDRAEKGEGIPEAGSERAINVGRGAQGEGQGDG